MTAALGDRLARCTSAIVHDVMRAQGLRDFVLPADLRPILPEMPLAGPAFTIEGRPVAEASAEDTLLAWTGLLSRAPADHVWVSQPHDHVVAHMGELSAETLKNKGLRGAVVDGGARDVGDLQRLGFQTWCRFFTPRDVVGYWMPSAIGEDIRIGDVMIAPGDYLLGDRDGLVRIPQRLIEPVLDAAEHAMAAESQVRTAIRGGMDPQEAFRRYGVF